MPKKQEQTTTTENLTPTAEIIQEEAQPVKNPEKLKVRPKIIGGVCEYCGVPAKDCEHYRELFSKGVFTCLCQHNLRSASAFQQSRYLYVEGVGFLCDGSGCQTIATARGLITNSEIYHHFMP
jgi:hypothetical protein